MAECARHATHDAKAVLLPEAHGTVVGGDDEIELHCEVPALSRRGQ